MRNPEIWNGKISPHITKPSSGNSCTGGLVGTDNPKEPLKIKG